MKWIDAPIWVKIGRRIKCCRKWKGLTQEKVALVAKIDLKRYKRIERAIVKDITIEEAFRIKEALHVSQEEIIPLLD